LTSADLHGSFEFGNSDLGSMISGFWFRAEGCVRDMTSADLQDGERVSDFRFRVHGFGFRVRLASEMVRGQGDLC
jgi:hypothetical protein